MPADDAGTETAMEIGYHASHEQFAPSRLLEIARQVEDAGFDAILSSDHAEQFEAAAHHIPVEELEPSMLISADPGWHAEALARLAAVGIDRMYLHQVGPDQERFVD